jgi:hypothetical protein
MGSSIFVKLKFVVEGKPRVYVTKPICIQPIRMTIIFQSIEMPKLSYLHIRVWHMDNITKRGVIDIESLKNRTGAI